jgi:hypothetical protein
MADYYHLEMGHEPTRDHPIFGPVSLLLWSIKKPDGQVVYSDPDYKLMKRVHRELEKAHARS